MHIISKFMRCILSRIALKIGFYGAVNMYIQQRPLQQESRSWYLRNIIKNLLLWFCIWTSYVSLSDYLVIFTFHTLFSFFPQRKTALLL